MEEGTTGPFYSVHSHSAANVVSLWTQWCKGGWSTADYDNQFLNYYSGYIVKSGNILYMWQKKVLKQSQQIPVYQVLKVAIITDVEPSLIL